MYDSSEKEFSLISNFLRFEGNFRLVSVIYLARYRKHVAEDISETAIDDHYSEVVNNLRHAKSIAR